MNGIVVLAIANLGSGVVTVAISPSLLLTGANIIAFSVSNQLPIHAWLAYELVVN